MLQMPEKKAKRGAKPEIPDPRNREPDGVSEFLKASRRLGFSRQERAELSRLYGPHVARAGRDAGHEKKALRERREGGSPSCG